MQEQISCPNCGHQIARGTKFCRYCGANLVRTSQPQQSGYQQPKTGQKTDWLNIIAIIAIAIFVIGLAIFIYSSI